MGDGFYRLKGVCNINISDASAEYVPGDHKDALEEDAEFIHWTPAYSDTATVRMPDGENLEGPIEPNQIEKGEVVQFERFGFVRCDSKENSLYYYAHQ